MDVYCPRCGEPIDPYEFHDYAAEVDTTYAEVAAQFRAIGCEALGMRCGYQVAHPGIAAMYDLLGDDMDGAASMFEDMGLTVITAGILPEEDL